MPRCASFSDLLAVALPDLARIALQASYRALQMQPPRDSLSDGFARTVVFRSDEQFVVAQYLPLFPASSSPLAAARSADSSSATSPAAFDPSFSDFNFAATGAVTYLILVSPIERLPSPNMLWSHLASLGDPLPRQKSLISQLTDLPVFATLSSTLIDNKLSLSPPPEPTAEVEQQEETEEAKPNVVLSPSVSLPSSNHYPIPP